MTPKSIFFVLLFAGCCAVLCHGKKSYRIGAFFNQNQLDFPINWDVINDTISQDIAIFYPDVTRINGGESLEAMKFFCDSFTKEEPLLAVFSLTDESVSSTLASMCSYFHIPFITTSQKTGILSKTNFNLYPEANLISQGLGKIVKSFDWDGFIILYENDENLLKLQDIIKLQVFSHGMKETENVMILKLNDQWDNRHLLKSLRNVTIRRIILDCHVDRVMDILFQAKEINILSDFSTSVFVTSLDAHTLNFTSLNVLSNITTVRLFDLNDKSLKETVKNYFPGYIPENKIRVESALFYDSLLFFASAINLLEPSDLTAIDDMRLSCDSPANLQDDSPLFEKLRQVIVTHSLTGKINLENGVRDKFILEALEVDNPNKPIGIWYSEEPQRVKLTRNATEREADLQNRLSSHNFIVTSRIGAPYLFENKDPNAVGNARYYGYSMDLISEIAKLMNITFEFRITEGNLYANLANDLIERRADLGICDFTITPQRQEIIDFSMPFMNLGIGILHRKSTQVEEINMYGFMDPFSWTVWLYMWSLNLIISLAMFIVARLAPNEWEPAKPWDTNPEELENIWDIKNFLWLTLGSITTQGCDILPKAFSTRVISAVWWFFSLIMSSSYTANLAAFLTAQKKEVVIDNVEELAAQSRVKYGLVEGASTSTFFSNSNNSLYQKMWNTMVNEKPSLFEPDNARGVDRVLATKDSLYAFFMESTGIEYVTERQCELRKIGNLLDSKSYGIGMPMNADYRHQINTAVLKLQESGKLGELKEKWWKKMRDGEPCPPEEAEPTALTLANVGGIFIVLGVGIGIAYLVAMLEFLWNVRRISVEEKVPFLEALKIEVKFACNIFQKKKRAKIASKKSSIKSASITANSKENVDAKKSVSHLSVPVIVTNNENDKNLRKRSGSSRTIQ